MKISLKFFIVIAEIGIIPLLITGYISYFNVYQSIAQNNFDKLSAIAQIQKNRLRENIDDKNEILSLIDHECVSEDVSPENVTDYLSEHYNLTIENLNDELKFETVRNLYNNLTLEELQEIENKIKIRII